MGKSKSGSLKANIFKERNFGLPTLDLLTHTQPPTLCLLNYFTVVYVPLVVRRIWMPKGLKKEEKSKVGSIKTGQGRK